ncbi:MAG: MipA/OmpV family protein [Novosphingobium sp.]|nr:MipA/OmpV family protein [Novosphingobium sp.]
MRNTAILCGVLAALVPLGANAQTAVAPEESVLDGDHLTIGAGVIYGPSYEGSDDFVATPVPVVQGRLAGISITPRPGGVALDMIPDGDEPEIGFSLGPVATFSGNRRNQVKDPVVRSAGKLKETIELGVNGGVTFYKLLHDYDSLTVSADVKWDVNGAHGGMVAVPQVSYLTPLSRAAFVNISLSATHDDDDHADYYYSVSPAQSAASGLPTYQAKGGWTKASAAFLGGYDLDGNILNGGFAIFVLGNYSRLMNDAKANPYTAIRGDADQWTIGAGVGYTF